MPSPNVLIIIGTITILSFLAIYKSLIFLKLKSEVSNYYEFSPYLPGSSAWSVVFYFIIVAVLLLLAFLFMQMQIIQNGNIVFRPA